MSIFTAGIIAQLEDIYLGPTGQWNVLLNFSFSSFVQAIIILILIIATIVFLAMLLLGGIQWISSGEDKNLLEAAKNKISNALIGLLILFSTWAIIGLVECFFGVSIRHLELRGVDISPPTADFCASLGGGDDDSGGQVEGGGLAPGTGVTQCPCNNSGCARLGQDGYLAGNSYLCTDTGWQLQGPSDFFTITCYSCP